MTIVLGACGPQPPEGAMTAAELLKNPVYETEVQVYGRVGALGELLCPCFILSSGGDGLDVWYDLMVEEDGTVRPEVSVEGIENGDTVVVTGELQSSSGTEPSQTFWATHIERLTRVALHLSPSMVE
jgi:hypothetical protein